MIGALFVLMFGLIALFGFVFWIWMLVDCATKESDQGNTKIVWIIIIVFTNLVGAVLYFFVQRQRRLQRFYDDSRSSTSVGRPL
jgi:prolipoprotein diacylglyceryltransferase